MKHSTTDQIVLSTLRKSKEPLSAYAILDKLKKHGIKSPPLVYRALEKLTRSGTAHRVDALASYVACSCSHDHHHPLSLLTVCVNCSKVSELHDDKTIRHLLELRDLGVNLPEGAVVELPVTCPDCAA